MLGNNTPLRELVLSSCEGLSYLPPNGLGNLVALEKLEVKCCHNLTSIPVELGTLKSLQVLVINSCEKLTFLPDGLILQDLVSLRNLRVCDCTKLRGLPSGLLKFCTSLESLIISSCPARFLFQLAKFNQT